MDELPPAGIGFRPYVRTSADWVHKYAAERGLPRPSVQTGMPTRVLIRAAIAELRPERLSAAGWCVDA